MTWYTRILILPLVFFLDLCGISIYYHHFFHLLLCLYAVLLYSWTSKHAMRIDLLATGGLLLVQATLFYTSSPWNLLYLIPLTAVSLQTQKTLYVRQIQPALFLTAALCIQDALLGPQAALYSLAPGYTALKISANIIVAYSMLVSLKQTGSRQARQSLVSP